MKERFSAFILNETEFHNICFQDTGVNYKSQEQLKPRKHRVPESATNK